MYFLPIIRRCRSENLNAAKPRRRERMYSTVNDAEITSWQIEKNDETRSGRPHARSPFFRCVVSKTQSRDQNENLREVVRFVLI